MKRQRIVECSNGSKVHVKFEDSTMKMGKKRGVIKEEVGNNKVVVAEEECESNDLCPTSTMQSAVLAESGVLFGWDQENWWPWLSGAVDEWGSCWLPFWDVEFMGEAYNLLFGDVVWDDDIWGIRGIKEVSNS